MKMLGSLLILTALAVAGFLLTQRRGPTISPLEVAWTPDGFVLAFTRDPAGPAAVRLTSASGEKTTPTSSTDNLHHVFELRGLMAGQRVTVTPLADQRAGPPVALTSRASTIAGYEEKEGAGGALLVTFKTAAARRCRLQVKAVTGPVWLDWESAPATDHALEIPASHAPVLGALAVELQAGDDAYVEPIVPSHRLRTARRARLAEELAARTTRALVAVKRQMMGKEKGNEPAPPPVLPVLPPWLAEELGGPGGALDDFDLPPRRKEQLYRDIVELGDADREQPPPRRAGWCLLPRGRDFGTTAEPHYPQAVRMPLVDSQRNLNAPILLLNPLALKSASKEDLFAVGEVKSPDELSGIFELERIGTDSRVELRIRARLPIGRALEAEINQVYKIRLNDPEKADGQVHDWYTAFDPAYLVSGVNELTVRDADLRTDQTPDARTMLEPPGLEIRFQP